MSGDTTSPGFVPHHQVLTAPGANPSRTTLVAHGILGSAANWRGFVRGMIDGRWGDVERARDTRWVLVDLRGHGDSHGAPPPHTVAACADDLRRLESHLGFTFDRAVGHSFGGKVVLALLAMLERPGALQSVWCLDSPPGPSPAGSAARDEIAHVVATLRSLSPGGAPLPGRAEVAAALEAAGMSTALAQWMTTNVRGTAELGYRWKFDLDVVDALVADYFACDLRPLVASPPSGVALRMVVGGRSSRFDAAERQALADHPEVRVDVLPTAGHWVHVDDPAGLAALLTT